MARRLEARKNKPVASKGDHILGNAATTDPPTRAATAAGATLAMARCRSLQAVTWGRAGQKDHPLRCCLARYEPMKH